jgi:hypothetical protein
VINTISINKTTMGFEIPLRYKGLKEANNNTMAMLIKLLATNMIANNRFGFAKSDRINERCFAFWASASLKVALLREKKATSAPEMSAEDVINPNRSTPFSHTKDISNEKRLLNKAGSGSNYLLALV